MGTKDFKFSNATKHLHSQCKVVIYPWTNVLNDPDLDDSALSSSGRLDISSQITSVSFNKNMGSAAGSFSFQLTNSPNYGTDDWKDIIKRGYWVVIWMSNEGDLALQQHVTPAKPNRSESHRIRCIGYVERVAVSGKTQENRSLDIGFTVSGRDFGIIYEETNIWHNLFKFDKLLLDSIAQTKLNVAGNTRVHDALQIIHDLFYYPKNLPGAKVNDNSSLLSIGLQWLLPRAMVSDIGFSSSETTRGTFWGSLPGITNFSRTDCGIAVDKPGDYLSGNSWEQLRRLSVPPFHELFCETNSNGKPQLNFRPIPWGIDQSDYPKRAQTIKLYKDIKDIVLVPAVDLYDFELGEDDHSRYNSFLATVSTSLIHTEDNIALLLDQGYPKQNTASIKRHGFRPMHVTVDSIVKNEELGNGAADQEALLEYNHILYDYWNQAVFAESGSVEKAGTNNVKVGRVMKFTNDVPYLSTKRYYIEGYTDSFTVGENLVGSWTQSITLTRGFEEADLSAKQGFLYRNVKFSGAGEFTKKNQGAK